MATSRPFAYNTGSTIVGSIQTGSLAIGTASVAWQDTKPGGVQWWQGPDEDLGYVIAYPVPANNVQTPTPISASVRFKRSAGKTDSAFINLVNNAYSQNFTTTAQCYNYVTGSLFWTSFNNPTSGSLYGSMLGSAVNNSWLTVPGNAGFAPGTGDFTVEWFQYQTNNGNENFVFNVGSNTLATAVASGGNRLNVYVGGSRVSNATISPSLSIWYHVAIARSGSTLDVYFNGTRIDTLTNTTNINDSSSVFFIGTQNNTSPFGDNWPGNITNFRFVKGSALYTGSTLTIPTTNLTAVSGTQLLLLFQTAGSLLTDSSGTSKVVSNGGAITWSALTPF